MPSESKKLPGVLMLLLSALGILFSLLIVAGVVFSLQHQPLSGSSSVEQMSIASTGALALLVGLLQIPALVLQSGICVEKSRLSNTPPFLKRLQLPAWPGWD